MNWLKRLFAKGYTPKGMRAVRGLRDFLTAWLARLPVVEAER